MDDESARLLKAYVEGDSDAATEIYVKYVARLIAMASSRISEKLNSKFDAEDVVQSAYRSFFRKAKDDQIVLKRSGDLWRVLAAFTHLKTLKRIEKETGQKNDPDQEIRGADLIRSLQQREPTPDEAAWVVDLLQHYLDKLDPRDRLILELRLRGESVAEIADELKNHTQQLGETVANTQEAVIRRVIRQAKRELKAMLFDE